MRATAFIVAGLLSLSPCFGKPLGTADEIRGAIAGNTLSGTENGAAYSEYYELDGFIRGREANDFYTGEWRIDGRQLCVRYFDDSATPEASEDSKGVPGPWECSKIAVEGSRLIWVSDGEETYSVLRQGNPDKL